MHVAEEQATQEPSSDEPGAPAILPWWEELCLRERWRKIDGGGWIAPALVECLQKSDPFS
jgi:hypothetical protein